MKMYIANCTKQTQELWYRLPSIPQPRKQQIDIGMQTQIAGGLNKDQIDYIVTQLNPYGLVHIDDIIDKSKFVGMCYAVDTPVNMDRVRMMLSHNDSVLEKRGRETREQAAIAVNQAYEDVAKQTEAQLAVTDIDIIEMKKKDGTEGDFSESLRVDRNEEHGTTVPRNESSRQRKRRK